MTVLVCIPAYNAGPTIAEVIRQIQVAMQSTYSFQILVVDDGSTDETVRAAAQPSVRVTVHQNNLGKGRALQTAFDVAVREGFEWVVTIDADLQHDPFLIPRLIETAIRKDCDIVIGSRSFDRRRMSPARIFSNTTTSWLISRRIGQRIEDSQSGFRVIRTTLLPRISLRSSRFATESELLIKAGRIGARIGSFPIQTVYGNETSHIRHVADTFRFIRMYCQTWFDQE